MTMQWKIPMCERKTIRRNNNTCSESEQHIKFRKRIESGYQDCCQEIVVGCEAQGTSLNYFDNIIQMVWLHKKIDNVVTMDGTP